MRRTHHTETKAETKTLLAATLACYLLACASLLTMSYSLVSQAAADLGRQAVAVVGAPYGL